MAEQNPPTFLQAGSHPAEDTRRFIGAVVADRPGIVGAGDFAVTENGTPNMSVNVAAGRAFIVGTEATFQGTYMVEARSVTNLAISAANATNPRKDLIVAKVQDAAYSGGTNAWSLAVVTGTPAASPAEPSAPANALVLAMVDVPALDTAITNSQITDRRTTTSGQGRAAGLGGIIVATAATRPAHSEGRVIYETDTDKVLTSDGAAWNRALAFDGIGIYTSGTRPAHQEGRVIYETDTDKLKTSDGAAWNDIAPAASLFVRKSATESVTSSTTLQNDDHLVLAVAANTTYVMSAYLRYDGDGTGDLAFDFTMPTGAQMFWTPRCVPATVAASSGSIDVTDHFNNGGLGTSAVAGSNGASSFLVAAPIGNLVVAGTAGNLQLQWAQSVSSATPARITAGSWLRLDKVA